MDHLSNEDLHEDSGHIITRAEALKLFTAPFILGLAGVTGLALTDQKEQPLIGSCVARPQMTEGPFYVDTNLLRSDIREDSEGFPLRLTINVSHIQNDQCIPLENALVDIWHADANGDYSGVGSLRGEKFLRGIQSTDSDGNATFTTVYPGWYRGRAPHIHFKVRSSDSSENNYEFTSQLFFEDQLSREIYQKGAYAARGIMDMPNNRDGIYRRNNGAEMMLNVSEMNEEYDASFNMALYMDG